MSCINIDVQKFSEKSQNWFSENECEFLYNLASKCEGNGVILEIGNFDGISTALLAKGSKNNNKSKVYTIDSHKIDIEHKSWYGKRWQHQEFKTNIKNFMVSDIVFPYFREPKDIQKSFNKNIELFFINESLNIKEMKELIENWYPKILNNGVILAYSNMQNSQHFILNDTNRFEKIQSVEKLTLYKKLPPKNLKGKIHQFIRGFKKPDKV